MPALITQVIPQQNFELVLDGIGVILELELPNQQVLDNTFDSPTIWKERAIPLDKTEIPAVNITLSSGDYSGKDATLVAGKYHYNIDCYTQSAGTDDDPGDKLAALKLHRIIGKIRAILENPAYNTLGFARPSINRVYVAGFRIMEKKAMTDAHYPSDALSNVMARISFVVDVPEYVQLGTGKLLTGSDTTVKLYETEKGYYYKYTAA